MRAEIINVTPQMASGWLGSNTDNRQIRRTVVEGLKAALMRGEYVPTHQGIAFSEAGVLMDGQHRLTAISEMRDGSFPMLVTWGVSPDAFKVMDIGIKRTAADSLKIDRRLTEVARLAAVLCGGRKSMVTPTQLIPFIEVIEWDHQDLMMFCGSVSKIWSSAPARLSAVVSILNGGDRDYVKAVYRALVLSDYDAMSPVVQSLYRNHVNGVFRVNGTLDTIARFLAVFDPRKAQHTKIQVKEPRLAGEAVRRAFASALSALEADEKNPRLGADKGISPANYTAKEGVLN